MFKINKAIQSPVTRLFDGGWETMGPVKRDIDRRTSSQLRENIDYYAHINKEIRRFAKEIKELNPKHLGIICDTLELSNHKSMLTSLENGLDKLFKKATEDVLLPHMISASKKNPCAMDLAGAIIDNTDSITSKYALYSMSGGIMKNNEVSRQMLAVSKVIDHIAEETLQGSYKMDFSKQENFVEMLQTLIDKNAQPDNIKFLFKKLIPFTTERPEMFEIDVPKFISSKVDIEDVAAKLKMLTQLLNKKRIVLKDFDIADYLTKEERL